MTAPIRPKTELTSPKLEVAKAIQVFAGPAIKSEEEAKVESPVPPFPPIKVPLKVTVPEVVMGPPAKVSPVVPPDASTEVTVPFTHVPALFLKHPFNN